MVLVDDYLKADAAKKKEAEEQKRLQAEAESFEVGKDLNLKGIWRNGPELQTADGAFKFHLGGQTDYDTSGYGAPAAVRHSISDFNHDLDPNYALQDGTDFRRARLRAQGSIYEIFDFICEYEFANDIDLRRRSLGISPLAPATPPLTNDLNPAPATRFTQLWFGVNKLPILGTFRAGHQREWVTFTNGTGARYLSTFMERPLLWNAFVQPFNFESGYTLQRNYLNQRIYSWFGVFHDDTFLGGNALGTGKWSYSGRITCLPIWLDDGNIWVHLGADTSIRTLEFQQVRFRAQPLERAGLGFQVPNIVDTGTIFSNSGEQLFNLEYASAFGPLTLTSEFTYVQVPNAFTGGLPLPNGRLPKGVLSRGDYTADGWYVECLYFLTRGDHRGYRRNQPGYDRIVPKTNFFLVRGPGGRPAFGWGAWEVGMRYDYLNLSHDGINGGIYQAVTWGLNWFWNPNMRVMTDVSYNRRNFEPTDNAGRQLGDFWSFGTRFHLDF